MITKLSMNIAIFNKVCANALFNIYTFLCACMCMHMRLPRALRVFWGVVQNEISSHIQKSVAFPLYVILLYCFIFIENGR